MDYCKLNLTVKKDHFALPFIYQILDRMQTISIIAFWIAILITTLPTRVLKLVVLYVTQLEQS